MAELNESHFAAGRAVRRALQRAEAAHPGSPQLDALHARLADLRDAFRPDVPDAQWAALGGGTPKEDLPDDGGD